MHSTDNNGETPPIPGGVCELFPHFHTREPPLETALRQPGSRGFHGDDLLLARQVRPVSKHTRIYR